MREAMRCREELAAKAEAALLRGNRKSAGHTEREKKK
jgi:hypothetical protein